MTDILYEWFPNVMEIPDRLIEATWETIYMTLLSALIAGIFGIGLGIILTVTYEGNILENKYWYSLIDKVVNMFRSIPFIILLGLIYPFTRFIVGTTIGTTAAIVPLTVAAIPFYAKQVESALLEVDLGIVEAAEAMGATHLEIIFGVYLKEGLPSLIRVSSVTIVNLIGLTTMAGAIGAGGLGDLAISRGYNRHQIDVTIVTTILVVILVLISQVIGKYYIRKTDYTKK